MPRIDVNRSGEMEAFVQVVEAGGFSAAARLLDMSGELAAKRITDEQLAEVRALHYEMMACFARRDLSGYYRLNARIHTAINEAAANPVLSNTYRSINARVQSLRFRTNQNEAKWKHAWRLPGCGQGCSTGITAGSRRHCSTGFWAWRRCCRC